MFGTTTVHLKCSTTCYYSLLPGHKGDGDLLLLQHYRETCLNTACKCMQPVSVSFFPPFYLLCLLVSFAFCLGKTGTQMPKASGSIKADYKLIKIKSLKYWQPAKPQVMPFPILQMLLYYLSWQVSIRKLIFDKYLQRKKSFGRENENQTQK